MNLAEIFKVLGDETRLRIIHLLGWQECCVGEIEIILGISQSNASRHLNRLKQVQVITFNKEAQWVYYRLNQQFIAENKLLYQYLKGKFKDLPECKRDLQRVKKYKSSGLTCQDLREKTKQKNRGL
ncbi:MAG TPA: winged helix-turn-helix transcriptional regulator [Clostridia bacterium]|nr:metalloregulator ArsR/SmtB family transcription factor [Clostridia bacterium]HHY05645.1 winged helix-turn-helix transcriptional regulator [Clostridia bacterium]